MQEALAAGLPVVAADVGGQSEIAHPALELLAAESSAEEFAGKLARHPIRLRLAGRPFERAPRAWSLTLAHREPRGLSLDTIFATANLNAGGAQRSLVNLASTLREGHRFAVAVCGDTTHGAFATALAGRGIEVFRVTRERDDFAIAESLLAHASARGARTLCFWNVAPGVKLLVSRFAPRELRLIDVSPGRYAFEELDAAATFTAAIDHGPAAFYERLDTLVLKHAEPDPPATRRVVTIPNGVAARAPCGGPASNPRYLVSGRIAPSKRLEVVLEGFARLRERHCGAELHVVGVTEPRHLEYLDGLQRDRVPGVVFRGEGFDLHHLDECWTAAVVLGTHQGCPNAVLEALAAAIPVIANASGGTGELLVDGESGWLLPEDVDAARLADAMDSAWRDSPQAHGRAALARASHGDPRARCDSSALSRSAAGGSAPAP